MSVNYELQFSGSLVNGLTAHWRDSSRNQLASRNHHGVP